MPKRIFRKAREMGARAGIRKKYYEKRGYPPSEEEMQKELIPYHEIEEEAARPVRKTEAGKYDGQDMSNLEAAGNDEDGNSLKKK